MAKIMVVDDDTILCELLATWLRTRNHEVKCWTDGEAALAQVAAYAPELIILDAMMPILSGMEVLRGVKSDAATAHIPILMLTARRGETDAVGAFTAGAGDFLTKPFHIGELYHRIDMLLAANQREAYAAR